MIQLSSVKAAEELKQQVVSLEQSLTRTKQDSSDSAHQLDHSREELGTQIESLKEQLLSVEREREREREELNNRLKKESLLLSQTQQDLQTKDKVCSETSLSMRTPL